MEISLHFAVQRVTVVCNVLHIFYKWLEEGSGWKVQKSICMHKVFREREKLIILTWSTCIAFCIILCLNGYLCYIFTPSLKRVIIVSKLYQLKIIKTPSVLQYPNPTQNYLFTLALFKPLRNQIMEAADPLRWIQEEEWGREGFPVLSGPVFFLPSLLLIHFGTWQFHTDTCVPMYPADSLPWTSLICFTPRAILLSIPFPDSWLLFLIQRMSDNLFCRRFHLSLRNSKRKS